MKHVIIEGPDGAGKTTLAKRLCETNGWAYHHEGPPPPGPLLSHYASLLINAKEFTVFDRFHLGEMVYGPLLRGHIGMPLRHFSLMRRLIDSLDTFVIFCDPGRNVCEANLHEKELLSVSQRVQAYRLWHQVYVQNQFHARYNFSAIRETMTAYSYQTKARPAEYTSIIEEIHAIAR